MAENIKTPPNQDPRTRTPQGSDPNKPQKPGVSQPNRPEMDPDRDRQGVNRPEIDPDRGRQGRDKPMSPGSKDGVVDGDDLDEDESTARMDRH